VIVRRIKTEKKRRKSNEMTTRRIVILREKRKKLRKRKMMIESWTREEKIEIRIRILIVEEIVVTVIVQEIEVGNVIGVVVIVVETEMASEIRRGTREQEGIDQLIAEIALQIEEIVPLTEEIAEFAIDHESA
jgi:hypothetical protein